ncbi:NYN domain-containing protein [Candidatus Amarolinea aalborgensis]|jgi:predicted RNA-binding protein with PIN domain|uniref:NYN domain-containing protein n=1 Tax=Candidatus Amarolinea aalborgensis TaxID=2249329 RepID=UPI003BF94A7E
MSLLIDGHNLIGVLPSIELGDRDDEGQLLVRLRAYHGFTGKAMIVFFDSGDAPGRADYRSTPGVQVRFAQRPQTADDLIVAFLRKSAQPGQYAVITNDRELAGRARQLGASIISAHDFAAKMTSAGQPAVAATGDPTPDPRDPVFADLFAGFLAAEKDAARFSGQPAHGFEWWQEQLYGEDVTLAENAVHWLRRFAQRSRALPVLLDALTHEVARVRAAAALALGQMDAPAAVEPLAACLRQDTSSLVREAAAQALGQLSTPAALTALQAALTDPKRNVRKTAAAILAKPTTNSKPRKSNTTQ